MKVTPRKVAECIKKHLNALEVTPIGFANVDDPFNEVSKADPPDRAWYALASVVQSEGEEAHDMSFQVGVKQDVLKVYCTWDYSIFAEDDDEEIEEELQAIIAQHHSGNQTARCRSCGGDYPGKECVALDDGSGEYRCKDCHEEYLAEKAG